MPPGIPVSSHTIPMLALILLLLQSQASPHEAGLAAYRARDYGKAAEAFSAAIKTEQPGTPQYRESLLLLGQSYYMSSRIPQANEYLEKAVNRL